MHAQDKKAQVLLSWLRRGLAPDASVSDVQCYILAMGLTLQDINTVHFCMDEDGNVQAGTPDCFVNTVLTMGKVEVLLKLCAEQSVHRPRPASARPRPETPDDEGEHRKGAAIMSEGARGSGQMGDVVRAAIRPIRDASEGPDDDAEASV